MLAKSGDSDPLTRDLPLFERMLGDGKSIGVRSPMPSSAAERNRASLHHREEIHWESAVVPDSCDNLVYGQRSAAC